MMHPASETLSVTKSESADAELVGQDSADNSAKRRQVMEGARTVFTKVGFDGASMNDIARAAGVSKGTLYAYFESKERLFEAMIREDRAKQAERLLDFSHDGDDAEDLLRRFGHRMIDSMVRPEMLQQSRMVISACAKFPNLGRAFYEAGPCYGADRFAEVLKGFVAKGVLEIDDVRAAAGQYLDMLHGAAVKPAMFCAVEGVTPENAAKAVNGAVYVFMAAYRAKR
jgi:AcrR family transcriptional regulator